MSGFVNILFLIFEKGDKQKTCVRICKYTFLIFKKKGKSKKKKYVGICKYAFLIFEKGDKQKKMCHDL